MLVLPDSLLTALLRILRGRAIETARLRGVHEGMRDADQGLHAPTPEPVGSPLERLCHEAWWKGYEQGQRFRAVRVSDGDRLVAEIQEWLAEVSAS